MINLVYKYNFSIKFVKMKFTLGKQERLKRKKLIEKLYLEGKSIKIFPLKMIYIQTKHTSNYPAQVGVSVPKRNFKHAVDRNRLKRLMRESYRKNKYIVYDGLNKPYVFMISYLAKESWNYDVIVQKMQQLLIAFVDEIQKSEKKTFNEK